MCSHRKRKQLLFAKCQSPSCVPVWFDVCLLPVRLAFFEVKYQFYRREKLMWAVVTHYTEQVTLQVFSQRQHIFLYPSFLHFFFCCTMNLIIGCWISESLLQWTFNSMLLCWCLVFRLIIVWLSKKHCFQCDNVNCFLFRLLKALEIKWSEGISGWKGCDRLLCLNKILLKWHVLFSGCSSWSRCMFWSWVLMCWGTRLDWFEVCLREWRLSSMNLSR